MSRKISSPTSTSNLARSSTPIRKRKMSLSPLEKHAIKSSTHSGSQERNTNKELKSFADVWYLIPNLIGYFRFLLVIPIGLAIETFMESDTDSLTSTVTSDSGKSTKINYGARANAFLYLISSYLDLWDGTIARCLHQTSTFGQFVDYIVDILSECCWLTQIIRAAAIQSVIQNVNKSTLSSSSLDSNSDSDSHHTIPDLSLPLLFWFGIIMIINTSGLVLLAYSSDRIYWKEACGKYAPRINNIIFMRPEDGSYRRLGYYIIFLYQCFHGVLYVWVKEEGWERIYTNIVMGNRFNSDYMSKFVTIDYILMGLFLPWFLEVVHLTCILITQLRIFTE